MNLAVNFWLTAKGILPTTDAAILKANNIQNIIGIQSIDTGILGAVIAGIIVWMLHERFHNIRLPDALAFFGGTRFVPIVTTVVLGWSGWSFRWCGRCSRWVSTDWATLSIAPAILAR